MAVEAIHGGLLRNGYIALIQLIPQSGIQIQTFTTGNIRALNDDSLQDDTQQSLRSWYGAHFHPDAMIPGFLKIHAIPENSFEALLNHGGREPRSCT